MKRIVKVGNITLGDGKIYIQSMLNIPPKDIGGNIKQTLELEEEGCHIIRAAVPTLEDAVLIKELKKATKMPVVADIHFDYKIAIESVKMGADKIRINPGNIGSHDKLKAVVDICGEKGVPIRVGVNSGSLEKEILIKYRSPTADALAESALKNVSLIEELGFHDIVVSIKSSDVKKTIDAYRIVSKACSYPLHLGVTETGTMRMGTIKSAVGIGSLLCDNIGDTLRVSLTADPIEEVIAAKDILRAVGKSDGVKIIACPTCGRTKIDLLSLTERIENATKNIKSNLTIAVMGCAVNGPGEAREADIGIAGGDGKGVVFKKGEIIAKVNEDELYTYLMNEINCIERGRDE